MPGVCDYERPVFIRDPAFIKTLASSPGVYYVYDTGYTVCTVLVFIFVCHRL